MRESLKYATPVGIDNLFIIAIICWFSLDQWGNIHHGSKSNNVSSAMHPLSAASFRVITAANDVFGTINRFRESLEKKSFD